VILLLFVFHNFVRLTMSGAPEAELSPVNDASSPVADVVSKAEAQALKTVVSASRSAQLAPVQGEAQAVKIVVTHKSASRSAVKSPKAVEANEVQNLSPRVSEIPLTSSRESLGTPVERKSLSQSEDERPFGPSLDPSCVNSTRMTSMADVKDSPNPHFITDDPHLTAAISNLDVEVPDVDGQSLNLDGSDASIIEADKVKDGMFKGNEYGDGRRRKQSFSNMVMSKIENIHVVKKLGQLAATAIAGNDITSSCLYVAGICAFYAGIWAPIALILVSVVVLYAFRTIYSEVITALPVNGGTYTVLLNTTSKQMASLAGSLTILSYIATGVVSSSVAISYLQELVPWISLTWGPVIILAIFCALTIIGLKDSAKVAIAIFAFHLVTMMVLIFDCIISAAANDFE
jgi:hypothetical protein